MRSFATPGRSSTILSSLASASCSTGNEAAESRLRSAPMVEQYQVSGDENEMVSPHSEAVPLERLLHITHARQDEAWVQGFLIPALGLAEGQFWTRAEDDLGALKLEELERAVESCRYTLLVASSAARADEWTQFAGVLAQHLGLEEGKPRLLVVTRGFEPDSERAKDLLPLRQ